MRIRVLVTLADQVVGVDLVSVGDRVTYRLVPPPRDARERVLGLGGPADAGPVLALSEATVYASFEEFDPADLRYGPEVTGVVEEILAVSYGWVPVPGRPEERRPDPSWTEVRSVPQMIDESFPESCDEHVLTLRVPDDAVLPDPAAVAPDDVDPEEERRTGIALARRADVTGVALEALADDVARRYEGRMTLTRQPDRSAVSLHPGADGAPVHWARSEADTDGVTVRVGDGEWTLPAAPPSAAVIALLVEAAARGNVRERTVWHAGPPLVRVDRETVVDVADGREWIARESVEATAQQDGEHAVVALAGGPVDRGWPGDHRWAPWGPPAR